MRPQQQNRRMRGRNNGGNNNNRKGPNPLSRNYESNGPDVKIRGSAQQIAEKYATLARDAMSSGDRVMAENYLQHAEHYNRIIAAAQAQMPIQNVQPARDDFDDEFDDERDDDEVAVNGNEVHAVAATHGSGPQPVIEGVPAEVALNAENAGGNHGNRDGGRGRERMHGQRGERRPREGRSSNREEQGDNATGVVPGTMEDAGAAPARLAETNPAGLAAAVEGKEVEEAAARKVRRPRKPRIAAEAQEAGASAEQAPAAVES